MTRNLLDIDDLTPERAGDRPRPGRRRVPAPCPGWPGRGACFPEAVGQDPQFLGAGRVPARRSPADHPGDEVGIDDRESAEDVARTLAQYHAAIGARVLDHGVLGPHGQRRRRAGDQPPVRPGAPASGHR